MAFVQHINKENLNIIHKDRDRDVKEIGKDEKTKEITYFPKSSEDKKVTDYDEGPIPDMGQRQATVEEIAMLEDREAFSGERF